MAMVLCKPTFLHIKYETKLLKLLKFWLIVAGLVVLLYQVYVSLQQKEISACGGTAGYLAKYLQIRYTVLANHGGELSGQLELLNTGNSPVKNNDWNIYFCAVNPWMNMYFVGDYIPEMNYGMFKIRHINGYLYRLKPIEEFSGFEPKRPILIPFIALGTMVSRSNAMPRWFVTTDNVTAYTINSTASEELKFVSEFVDEKQWKRKSHDKVNIASPENRFLKTLGLEQDESLTRNILPTPISQKHFQNGTVDLTGDSWKIVYTQLQLKSEAEFVAKKLKLRYSASEVNEEPTSHFIRLEIGEVERGVDESYSLLIKDEPPSVIIIGQSSAGVFYGIQTLLSLMSGNHKSVPATFILDYPRFPYRGVHLDVARNFLHKHGVLKLLDAMATYKLNKFHFHLTDDEGWRLEIPGIEEATEVGSKRCFDLTEEFCILTQLGSGPTDNTSGSGHYTVSDYKEILQYAAQRHIEVIPEFDMPAHSHAIIKAMESRHKKRHKEEGYENFLLSDLEDKSVYSSVQKFSDNVINPCLESTYRFITHLIKHVKSIHQEIQPLKVFHFGGDEVPNGVWMNSSQCQHFPESHNNFHLSKWNLYKHFIMKISKIASEEGLNIAGWEDGFQTKSVPFPRHNLDNKQAYTYVWKNQWERMNANSTYNFANLGYKVVLCHATHLYFDHPQEAHPEERGLIWATRYTDMYKTFAYKPDDVYANVDTDVWGMHINKTEYCSRGNTCLPLQEDKRQNIIGIQGHLWSETANTPDAFDEMLFPRLLALAERAWHRARWEDNDDDTLRNQDWASFSKLLGRKELNRLDDLGVKYHIPPPGARVLEGIDDVDLLQANVMFPGLPIFYSTDGGTYWDTYKEPVKVPEDTTIHLKTGSVWLHRYSRTVTVN